MTCRVGLLDSGVDADIGLPVTAVHCIGMPDAGVPGGHGTAMAEIVALASGVEILDAQVFAGANPTNAAAVAEGLDWLVGEGANVINMSFGLARDRDILRAACERAVEAGVIMLGAAPARGAPVFPSSYPDVIRVTGDARCKRSEISALMSDQADFGAHPTGLGAAHGDAAAGGASYAVAHVTARMARWWQEAEDRSMYAAIAHLKEISSYQGPERRG